MSIIHFFDKAKASISIFLILILVPMYSCAYLAIDTARYSAAKAKTSGAIKLSGNAALASYDRDFKELYGLFVMSDSQANMKQNISEYFSNIIDSSELNLPKSSMTRAAINYLLDETFENTVNTKTNTFNLKYKSESSISNPKILDDRICDFMKYRAIENWTEGVSSKVDIFSNLSTLLGNNESDAKNTDVTTKGSSETSETISISDAKEQVEAIKEIGSADISTVYGNVIEKNVKELVGEDLYENITKGSTENSIEIDDFSLLKNVLMNAYEVEYITSMFGCVTTKENDENLLGSTFSNRPIMNSEIEYIIFGKENTVVNVALTVDAILAIRVILNTTYVYSNSSMRQSALSLATVLSGWTGLGIPIIQNVILLAWATAESVLDTVSLCNGETIPIYKTSSTWTLGLQGATGMLSSGVASFASKTIDDVFEKIEDASMTKMDEVEDAALNYIDQVGQSAVEELASAITIPVEKKVTEIMGSTDLTLSYDDVYSMLLNTVNGINNSSKGVKQAKSLFISYCLPTIANTVYSKLPDFLSGDETLASTASDAITDALDSAYLKLFSYLESSIGSIKSSAESKVSDAISNTKEKVKEETISAIKEYSQELSEYVGDSSQGNVSCYSGIGMDYVDYLRLFLLINMTREKGKENILKRCVVIMQINCKTANKKFDITKSYTAVTLSAGVNVGAHKITIEEEYHY